MQPGPNHVDFTAAEHVFISRCLSLQFQSVSVPYPKDKNNVKAKIDADQKEAVRDIGFVKVYFSIIHTSVRNNACPRQVLIYSDK